ncbi:beta strand repeat-containing protein, partial [Maribacter antarcticus]|uniref:beta strand repeat-containing protein n=1 Tax=Maribacter antarcticus TaxID=505250 RepID=UPI00047E4AC4
MKPIVILVLLLCLRTTVVLGQVKIGDNPQNIDASSVLELESTSKVLVITRVTTSQMDGITPQRGGMVYNTDTECIYYFDGAQWINLCDAVSFGITNAPIVNQRSTISITEATNSYNLEIEPGSIRSVHIATAGINGTNIQNNSIGPDKLGADAVGAEELADGAVGSLNIRDQSITTFDLASDDPNQVLITDEFGVVQWDNASNLTIEVALDIAKNTMDIADHIFEDADTVVGNESLASAIIDGDELVLNESNNETRVDLSGFNDAGTDDQNIVGGEVTGNQLRIDIEGGNSGTIDVSSLTGTGTDNQTLNLNGNLLGITSGNNVNLTKYTNTDNQTINRFDFNTATNQLTLEIQNGGTREITLNNLNNTGTDNQTLSITDDTLEISGGNALPLTAYINTDDQILEIDGNQLTITGLNGGTTIGLPASTVNTDEQQISINADGTEIMLERGGTIALPAGTVDTDDQNLSLAGNTISITDGTGIDLTPILGDVNTDEQNLSLAGTTLNITDGTGVDLAPILGEADTDEQNLSLAGTTLNITNGSSVELGPILGGTNTDEQNLSLTGNTLNITNGTGVDFNSILNLTNILTVGNSAGNSAINNLADPTLPQDAATKSYVDVTVVAAGGGVPTDELNQTFEVNGLNLELTDALGTLQVPLNQINTDNQNAAAVPFAPIGNTLSVDVQSAIVELQTEIDGIPAGEAANPFDELITTFSLTGTELNIAEGANIPAPINLDLIFATDAELASINGSETVVNSSGTVTVAGTGTTGNPYVLTATAGDGSET